MTDSRYVQGDPADKVIEECSELIQALCKLKRFGPDATDPFTHRYYDNIATVRKEMTDVVLAIGAYDQAQQK